MVFSRMYGVSVTVSCFWDQHFLSTC